MDENANKAIFNLMQIVVDKLEAISKDVNKNDHRKLNKNNETHELISKTISNQTQTNLDIENRIISSIVEHKTSPSITNNYAEYSFFGSKSHFKPKTLIIILFSLVIIWSSLKYIPTYVTENSSLNKEREEYQLFYNYVYLKQFKNDKIISANEILKKVRQKDSLFMKEYNALLNNYQNEIRKEELKEELNSLDNNDR